MQGEFEESKYSPKRTKEENIIGKKEKGVSPDTVLKNYWSGNEEFADLFNAVLFGGSQIIRADELEKIRKILWYWSNGSRLGG